MHWTSHQIEGLPSYYNHLIHIITDDRESYAPCQLAPFLMTRDGLWVSPTFFGSVFVVPWN